LPESVTAFRTFEAPHSITVPSPVLRESSTFTIFSLARMVRQKSFSRFPLREANCAQVSDWETALVFFLRLLPEPPDFPALLSPVSMATTLQ
jgi:hypothetical protein